MKGWPPDLVGRLLLGDLGGLGGRFLPHGFGLEKRVEGGHAAKIIRVSRYHRHPSRQGNRRNQTVRVTLWLADRRGAILGWTVRRHGQWFWVADTGAPVKIFFAKKEPMPLIAAVPEQN